MMPVHVVLFSYLTKSTTKTFANILVRIQKNKSMIVLNIMTLKSGVWLGNVAKMGIEKRNGMENGIAYVMLLIRLIC